ncbi:MAG TPA: hypothetical protein VK100_08085 [Pseudogracilibacillus sp.]|nr:hypothetical protein [Pseudogracilibacillus sp.]
MKRQLHMVLQNNEGFFLPYTIILSMFILLNITTMIFLHENDAYTNKTVNELPEIDTLIQMTKAKFIQDKLYEDTTSGKTEYHHPSGDVSVKFKWVDENIIEADTEVRTLQGTESSKVFRLYVSDEVVMIDD